MGRLGRGSGGRHGTSGALEDIQPLAHPQGRARHERGGSKATPVGPPKGDGCQGSLWWVPQGGGRSNAQPLQSACWHLTAAPGHSCHALSTGSCHTGQCAHSVSLITQREGTQRLQAKASRTFLCAECCDEREGQGRSRGEGCWHARAGGAGHLPRMGGQSGEGRQAQPLVGVQSDTGSGRKEQGQCVGPRPWKTVSERGLIHSGCWWGMMCKAGAGDRRKGVGKLDGERRRGAHPRLPRLG